MTAIGPRGYRFGILAAAVVFLSLATIRIGAPWRLEHEDTGARATTFAWAHLRLGLGFTKGHDFQVDARTGEVVPHAHHPPGSNLLLAGAFALTGSMAPAVTRGLSLVVTSATLVLIVVHLRRRYDAFESLLGAAALALIPMDTFFGRLVSGDPFALFAVTAFVLSYFALCDADALRGRWLAALLLSALFGATMEWQFFFGPLACLAHAIAAWLVTRRPIYARLAAILVGLGLGLFALDVGHIAWAYGVEGLRRLSGGFSTASAGAPGPSRHQPLLHVARYFFRYYTEILCVTGLFALGRWAIDRVRRRPVSHEDQVAMVFFAVGLMNMIAFPRRAVNHHYWSIYFVPFMAIAFVDAFRRLGAARPRALPFAVALALLAVAGSSVYTLVKRHREVSQYTLIVAEDQKRFLPP